MNNREPFDINRIKPVLFASAGLLHTVLLFFVIFPMDVPLKTMEPVAGVMKLFDVEEEIPPPPPPERPPPPEVNTQSALAETMIETEEEPPPVSADVNVPIIPIIAPESEEVDYLPQFRISVLPVFPEDEIRRAVVYPPIAQRSNIEGTVYLELFIDRQGNVRDVRILREDPLNRGFGEAAVNAFRGIKAKPAEANGEPVAVRYRYALSFTLK